MSNQQTDWVEILRNTLRYREAIQETAAMFTARSPDAYEHLARHLIDKGEDKALGILLRVSTMNGIKLDPNLLAETIKVVDVLDDFSVPYALQHETAIDPLLSVAQAEDISRERQAFAGILAAELAVRFDSDRQAVKRVLLKLSNKAGHPLDQYLIDEALGLLEAPLPTGKEMRFETQRDPLDRIPEEEPRVVTGGTYTVRRTVPKTGRNEPCHCGSGKKYKKCCLEKDRELMRDASPYEGVTMTQARTAPNLVDDAGIIEDMRAYELKKLDPSKLSSKQLYAAFHRAEPFGLREFAFEMLLELENRSSENEFDIGHFEDLLQAVLDAGDTALAEKIMDHVPREALREPEMVQLNYHLIKNRDQFIALENQCRKALIGSDDLIWEDPILNLGHSLEHTFPALSIVFSRASIVGNPDRIFDNDVLLDVIRSARAEIGLDPWSDPSEDYFEWTLDKRDSDLDEESKSKEVEELAIKVKEAGERASGKEEELRQREKELQDLAKSLEKEKEAVAAATQVSGREAPVSDEERQTVARLRQRIEDLKGEVQSQQHIRRELQQQLRQERRKAIKRQEQQPLEKKPVSGQALSIKPEKTPKKILIPEFTSEFQRSCESMPVPVVAKALRASTAFAAHDETVWRKTTTIKRLTHIYRIRLTIDHRLMIRWQPDENLQILEIIPRSQLETWIRQHAR